MHRNDISYIIIELLQKEFEWIDGQIESEEKALADFGLMTSEIRDFTKVLFLRFRIKREEVMPADVSKWKTVKDIVDYIEET